ERDRGGDTRGESERVSHAVAGPTHIRGPGWRRDGGAEKEQQCRHTVGDRRKHRQTTSTAGRAGLAGGARAAANE
ncbi:hypothetical protein KI387_020104, partial [Taxus chinensis]